MATNVGNWVAESCSTIGSGDLILTGVAGSSQSAFSAAVVAGDVFYSILDGNNREAGIGVFDGNNTIVRSNIETTLVNGTYLSSSPLPLELTGTAVVSCTYNAQAYQDVIASALAAESSASSAAASAASSAADLVLTNADVVLTHADVVLTHADLVQTNLDQIATTADAASTAADLIQTNLDQISSSADAATATTQAATATTQAGVATTQASNAATSASTATTQASTASTSASNAAIAQTNAEIAETNAETAQTAAELAQGLAENAQDAAELAASTATTQAGVATTQATNATTSASSAASSASAASSSASSAASSATSAAQSAASAATLLDNFDDRYLGAKASDPSVDNDGDPLVIGALYFNSTDGVMKTYTASGWLAASSASVATMAKFKFTATAGQTVFTGADDGGDTLSMTVGSEIVTLNGIVLESGTDYTPASGSITLATGATAGDELNVFAFGNFQVADTVSKSLGGTFTGAVTFENGTNYGNSSSFGQIRKSGGELEVNSYGTGGAAEPITFNQYTTERMRIDASGNVGIGTSSPAAPLQINDASTTSVGSTAGDYTENLRIYGNNGNNGQLSQYTVRDANGTNWTSSGTRLQMKIDTTYMGWMQFNGDGNDGGVSFGAGWSTPTPTGVPERMRIDSAGRVTMPYQPFFEATVSSGWATNSGVLVLPIVTRNIGNHYNSSTGVFTVPVAGVYQFVAKIYSFNSSISTSINKILVNGSFNGIDYGYFSNAVGDTHDKTIVLVCTKYLAAGDNITLSVDAEYYGYYTSFTGHLLG